MSSALISIVICLHNGARFICRAVESVLQQSHCELEVIVLDDGSTDRGAELVTSRFADSRLRIIRQDNGGLGHARRSALAAARGEFVAFLDQDDEWLPTKLARQLEIIEARSDIGLVFTDCEYIDERDRCLELASAHFSLETIDFSNGNGLRALLTRGCFIDISSVLARREAIDNAGGFDAKWRYVEDYDLWLRIARLQSLEYIPEPLTRRRQHDQQFTRRFHALALAEESALLRPFLRDATYPVEVRRAIRHYLFGQHKARSLALLSQRRAFPALRAMAGAAQYPGALLKNVAAAACPPVKRLKSIFDRGSHTATRVPTRLLLDGSGLDATPAGTFNLTVGLIRALRQKTPCEVIVCRASLLGRARATASAWWWRLRREPLAEVAIWRGRFSRSRSRKIAVVMDLTTRLMPDEHTPQARDDFDRFVTEVVRRADTVVTLSESSKRDILRQLRVFPESVHVMPMPMNEAFSSGNYSADIACRHADGNPYILFVGTREPRKNLRRLVNAFATACTDDSMHGHRLLMAGPAGWDMEFEQWLRCHPAVSRVQVLGFVPTAELASLYHFATAFIYPSLYEGFGLPVLEAMMSEAYVITSKTSSLPEVLGDGGRYVDPHCERDISAALIEAARLAPEVAARYRAYCQDRSIRLCNDWSKRPPLPGLSCA